MIHFAITLSHLCLRREIHKGYIPFISLGLSFGLQNFHEMYKPEMPLNCNVKLYKHALTYAWRVLDILDNG